MDKNENIIKEWKTWLSNITLDKSKASFTGHRVLLGVVNM